MKTSPRLATLAIALISPILTAQSVAPTGVEPASWIRHYDEALAQDNQAALAALLHPDFKRTTADGRVRDRAQTLAQPPVARSGVSDSLHVTALGNVTVITGRIITAADISAGSAGSRFTTIWQQTDNGWQMIARQETPILGPNPDIAPTASNIAAVASRPASAEASSAASAPDIGTARSRPWNVRALIRPYEPNQVGYTLDEDDDGFLDFTFSAMFALHPRKADEQTTVPAGTALFESYTKPSLYFAANLRAGQYIGTRPSSPVLGKRFNPLLALRVWGRQADRVKSDDNFIELAYGHESNGQFISSEARFRDQRGVYLRDALEFASADALELSRRQARDNISRGWDYVGATYARDWSATLPTLMRRLPFWNETQATISVKARANYYLSKGLAQGEAEEYNSWENDPEGKARKRVDGLSMRWAMSTSNPANASGQKPPDRHYALTYTTGYDQPFRYNTVKIEAGLVAFRLPVMVWYRYGYNSDLVDYYKRDQSVGVMLSFWEFLDRGTF